jgi:transglutaminase-like putative cysteine protease
MNPSDLVEPDRERVITCDLGLEIVERAEVALQITASRSAGSLLDERFDVRLDGEPVVPVEVEGLHGTRIHVLRVGPGRLVVSYRGELEVRRGAGTGTNPPGPSRDEDTSDYQRQLYLRPSRYCPSDHLVGFAVAEFSAAGGVAERVEAITSWIRERVGYVPGSSSVHDSAEHTLLTATGTCRDFAHLGVALCRAVGIAARFAAVYAPGLSPMDFHAVFETLEEGRWLVHDATGLAPRQSLVRIATGRDAADTAFMAILDGIVNFDTMEVSAIVGSVLPIDDLVSTVRLP